MAQYTINFNPAWTQRIVDALGKDGVAIEVRLKRAIKKAVGQAELDQFVNEQNELHGQLLQARAKQIEDEIGADEG